VTITSDAFDEDDDEPHNKREGDENGGWVVDDDICTDGGTVLGFFDASHPHPWDNSQRMYYVDDPHITRPLVHLFEPAVGFYALKGESVVSFPEDQTKERICKCLDRIREQNPAIDVGILDRDLGSGSMNVRLWEVAAAIGEDTAAIAYVARPTTQPPLRTVAELAHERDVPVVVDPAAELPPTENFSRFVKEGADLVAFSGGKAIRGPQSNGILAGRRDLIRSVPLQQLDMDIVEGLWDLPAAFFEGFDVNRVPRHGVGRGTKVGCEELVGLLAALEASVEEDDDERRTAWDERAHGMATRLADVEGLSVTVENEGDPQDITSVSVQVNASIGTTELVWRLQSDNPPIYVGYTGNEAAGFSLNPMCLTDDEAGHVTDRLAVLLGDG
jgi:L-seryl-tRNA(Ser) seleniumtransferase